MGANTCILFNVQRFSTEDGPGIRTTVFFKGCPLSCPWCHNPEGLNPHPEVLWQASLCLGCGDCILACPRQAIRRIDGRVRIDRDRCEACGRCVETCPSGAMERVGREYDVEDLIAEVVKDHTFYSTSGGGVTLSGGEPLMQRAFLEEFLPACRREGLHVALDTSGLARKEWLEPLLKSIDLVLFDFKLINPAEHRQHTGAPLDAVLVNLDLVAAAGLPLWVRTPVIPGYTDDEQNIRGIAAYLRARVPTLERYDLLAFSNLCTSKYEMLDRTFALAGRALLTPQKMEDLVAIVRSEGIDVVHWSGPTRPDGDDSTRAGEEAAC